VLSVDDEADARLAAIRAWPATVVQPVVLALPYPMSDAEELDSSTTTTPTTTTPTTTTSNTHPISSMMQMGSVWTGNQTQVSSSCPLVPLYLDVYAQAIPADDHSVQLLSTASGFFPNLGYCTVQALFSTRFNKQNVVMLTPVGGSNGVEFSRCAAYASNVTIEAEAANFTISPDQTTLTFSDSCSYLVLQRQ